MKELYVKHIAAELGVKTWQVENCIQMFGDGDTIPFISRYRKEQTGGMDDATVAEVRHLMDVYDEMESRKQTILKNIDQAGALTSELRLQIENSLSSTELEDLYLPYRPKRRTRATMAKEKGLEPLADGIWEGRTASPEREAQKFTGKEIESADEALAGARDIIAERLSEHAGIRERLRSIFRRGRIQSSASRNAKGSPEAEKYRYYFKLSMPLERIPAHNLLAMLRGQDEGWLTVGIGSDAAYCSTGILKMWSHEHQGAAPGSVRQLRMAAEDAFERLLEPSISGEVIREAKARADVESIRVFGENLRQLLLSPPLGQKRTMAVDPGFRNGCKIACLGSGGELLDHCIIYPHPPQNDKVKAIMTLQRLVNQYGIEAIAVGNGTASRETVEFLKRIQLPAGCKVWTVSEDGASIYSASEIARQEFPDEDVTVRGAVSIGRRLMDPLAELVKIDPKNLGIGQYQHDVDQNLLREMLNNTVESCVNSVGVNLNTASPWLLAYVSGIGPSLAGKIVEERTARGGFRSREELLQVPKLGAKTFKLCAGFLRIRDAENPLDNSAVHPESYPIVDRMAASLGVSTRELVGNAQLCSQINAEQFTTDTAGPVTINDILKELAKPGLDPREQAAEFSFAEGINSMDQLQPGMELPGIVTNITNFGAFVDIGLHENGLIHVSRLGPRGTDPSKVLKLHQHINARVISVDLERKRIALDLIKS